MKEITNASKGIFAKQQARIANGASLSGAIDLNRFTLKTIYMPAAWTTANLTVQISSDGTNFSDFYDKDGNEFTITAAASRGISLAADDLSGANWIKIRSGTSAAAVNQGADRDLILVGRAI